MEMKDILVKSISKDNNFRVYAINGTNLVSEMQKINDNWSTTSAALGRTAIATLLLANSVLSGRESMTVRLDGKGPVGMIVMDADANGNVKGYAANPKVNLPLSQENKIDVASGVGTNGFLEVMKNSGGDEPYRSNVELQTGEIGDDFTYYLAKSEQIPSAVGVTVDIDGENNIISAGGYLVQVMPGASDDVIDKLQNKIMNAPSIATMLEEDSNPENILWHLFDQDELKILDHLPVQFKCECSKEKFANSIAGISNDELQAMIDDDHGAEVVCNFCGSKYQFSEAELKKILEEKNN